MFVLKFLFLLTCVQFLSAQFTWQKLSKEDGLYWSKVATDRSGQIIAALTTTVNISSVYISRDQGSTWTTVEPAGHYEHGVPWGAIAMDKSGTYMYAAASGFDPPVSGQKSAATGIYVSTNGGNDWTKTFDLPITNCGSCVATLYQMSTSYDGRVVALASTHMQLAISEDYGKTWRYPVAYDSTATTTGVAMDSTGQYIVSNFKYGIQRSTDYGHTWTTVTTFSSGGFGKMSSSANGQYLSYPSTGGPIVSNDYGTTWLVARADWGGQTGAITAMDETGQYLVAENSHIYESTNYGQAFYSIGSPASYWRDLVNTVNTETGERLVIGAATAWYGYNVSGIYLGKYN